MSTLTVHMIGNAHLDPVWLWPWQRGADEALATCRSACDILDDYPDFVFTRGEAWVHEQVRAIDPVLFERIRAQVRSGRWAVVNGWWVQADVNLPTEEALRATARLGQQWFREHLDIAEVPVAYNVDSFGHGAYLPRILREAGHRYYIMMRPMAHEKPLPANLFRWRSPDGHEVLTFRINNGYLCTSPDHDSLKHHVQAAVQTPRPAGVDHVMCFYGVGNHGGGPTRKLVNWILAHRDFAPNVRLEFSSPQRFFAAVEADAARCPVVEGELQYHAIGCYSVCGALKRDVRNTELAAIEAERLMARTPATEIPAIRQELDAAWEVVCFNQFHDILPGSAIAEGVATARQELGGARSRLDRLVYRALRRDSGVRDRPVNGHRLHVANPTSLTWSGLADVEDAVKPGSHLRDEEGRVIPHQFVTAASLLAESFCPPVPRVLFPITLKPAEIRTLSIVEGAAETDEPGTPPRFEHGALDNGLIRVDFGPMGIAQVRLNGKARLARPLSLVSLADGSDTWSHDIDRYAGPVHAIGTFGAPAVAETGPLRTSVRLEGVIGRSPARLIVSLDRQAAQMDLQLEVNYQEPLTVLKASVAPAGGIAQRRDRVAGGWLGRRVDGREYPVHHVIRLNEGDSALALVFPDSFAADCSTTGSARVTLLRNSVHAYHSGSRLPQEDVPGLRERFGTDEGPQSLRLSLVWGATETEAELALARLQRPPILWDDYRGISRVQGYE